MKKTIQPIMRASVRTGLAVVAVMAALQTSAYAQSIRLPDLTESVPTAQVSDGPCGECGVIRSIRELHKRRDAPLYAMSTPGFNTAFDSRVVGTLVVLPLVKRTSESTASTGIHAAPEINDRFAEVSYELTLRMENGFHRTLERRDGGLYSVGDRVRISAGRLEMLEVATSSRRGAEMTAAPGERKQ